MNQLFMLRHVRYFFSLLVILAAHGLVAADSETPVPPPSAPIEREFRFLVVSEDGKPVDGIPFGYSFSVTERTSEGAFVDKRIVDKLVLSANGGVVEVPKNRFNDFFAKVKGSELLSSPGPLDQRRSKGALKIRLASRGNALQVLVNNRVIHETKEARIPVGSQLRIEFTDLSWTLDDVQVVGE